MSDELKRPSRIRRELLVDRVLELHKPIAVCECESGQGCDGKTWFDCAECDQTWPCRTIQAVGGE